jgi:hypothetical protein
MTHIVVVAGAQLGPVQLAMSAPTWSRIGGTSKTVHIPGHVGHEPNRRACRNDDLRRPALARVVPTDEVAGCGAERPQARTVAV